jgi:hypothetical protein
VSSTCRSGAPLLVAIILVFRQRERASSEDVGGTSSFTFTRLSDKALSATTSEEPDIAIAAISGLKIRPIEGDIYTGFLPP